MTCSICNSTDLYSIEAAEQMLGTGQIFTYSVCRACQALELQNPPADMAPYYPDNYYSFSAKDNHNNLLDALRRKLTASRYKRSLLGRLINLFKGEIDNQVTKWLRLAEIDQSQKILDFGCGSGNFLLQLHSLGFTDLAGFDPFTQATSLRSGKVKLYTDLSAINRNYFDMIFMHHSLEHTNNHKDLFSKLNELLRPSGKLLIRTPNSASLAFQEYQSNWVQLDAPRHLIIHSPNSLKHVARAAGFDIEKTLFDSTAFQFWGSEQYLNKIPLNWSPDNIIKPHQMFSELILRDFEQTATRLNAEEKGDQFLMLFKKIVATDSK